MARLHPAARLTAKFDTAYQRHCLSGHRSPHENQVRAYEKDWEDYTKGGYYPVHIVDAFSMDATSSSAGSAGTTFPLSGSCATQSTCLRSCSPLYYSDSSQQTRLEVVKSAPRYIETTLDDLLLDKRYRVCRLRPLSGRARCLRRCVCH
ncbi:hypothetical protein K439DRAFT_564321 [Ramaria rubella]|nr:hypothetical protein K439DRAFT_564321 [Ramaria rubella]